MSFFDSPMIRSEVVDLQMRFEELQSKISTFSSMPLEEKREFLCKMTELIEKQKILYMRLLLSDDPIAVGIRNNMDSLAKAFGSDSLLDILSNMQNRLERPAKTLDNEA